jgi:large repetitive protein
MKSRSKLALVGLVAFILFIISMVSMGSWAQFVIPAPVADFTSTVTNGSAPLAVQFNDTSSNGPTSWFWNFGDGCNSTLQNPVHIYNASGMYTVTLNATNNGGSNQTMKTGYITVSDLLQQVNVVINSSNNQSLSIIHQDIVHTDLIGVPAANFTYTILNETTNTVQFNDTSSNSPTSWSWIFGYNGGKSTAQNPIYTYDVGNNGPYTVTLVTSNSYGISTPYRMTVTV